MKIILLINFLKQSQTGIWSLTCPSHQSTTLCIPWIVLRKGVGGQYVEARFRFSSCLSEKIPLIHLSVSLYLNCVPCMAEELSPPTAYLIRSCMGACQVSRLGYWRGISFSQKMQKSPTSAWRYDKCEFFSVKILHKLIFTAVMDKPAKLARSFLWPANTITALRFSLSAL